MLIKNPCSSWNYIIAYTQTYKRSASKPLNIIDLIEFIEKEVTHEKIKIREA
ncbi:Uncharacterized protein dnl_55070 [Desulfonema limicola]|uniref:Uncharacterized protein n=1 Tax=Desulfonema limicola TaxID=45656 RepID=A0A975GJJ8_9BACT|nr:Uncharacterized protein dnl_55070 [Desulfonema limicola]